MGTLQNSMHFFASITELFMNDATQKYILHPLAKRYQEITPKSSRGSLLITVIEITFPNGLDSKSVIIIFKNTTTLLNSRNMFETLGHLP